MEDNTPLSIVMIDVNGLKNINDSYGHDAGDKYLRGCCKIICEIYKHSPVFRIGGDEFVAILVNTDYENREKLIMELDAACEEAIGREDSEPWEKYSVAAGMSDCTETETALRPAFSRADKAMYEVKREYKKKKGLDR